MQNTHQLGLPYLTRVPHHVDVGCYLTIQTKLLYLLSGGSVLFVSFLSSFAGTSGRFPSGGPISHAFYIAYYSYQVFHLFLAHDVSKNLTCLFTISLSSFLFVFDLRRTSTFVTCSVYEILCILLMNHISVASSLFYIFGLSVQASDPYNNVELT